MTSPRRTRSARPMPAAAAAADDDAVRSWLAVVRAYHLCDALMAQRLAALDVKLAEHEILANLRREPGITQQQLAHRCFSAKSHISTLLAALEARGWVRREADPADARAKRLFLDGGGERIAARTARVQAEIVAAMAASTTPESMAVVTDAMRAVSARLEAMLDQG